MTLPTNPALVAQDVAFRAEICWLGPIMTPPCKRGAATEILLAGAEDPALGQSFCYVLQPVRLEAKHYRPAEKPPRKLGSVNSDRYGWFEIPAAPTELWDGDGAGVLVILLYNESRSLEYYTYSDWPGQDVGGVAPDPRTGSSGRVALRAAALQRILGPMPTGVSNAISDKITEAIDDLLKDNDAETLRRGLIELPKPPIVPFDCAIDPASSVEPPAADAQLIFAIASCQYPSVMLEDRVAGGSYERLGKRLSRGRDPKPQCLLLVGDQIYVDGTAGLFDPSSAFDRYVRPYEIVFRMDPVRDVLRRLPVFTMLDDHEIRDNWEPRTDDIRTDPVMVQGRRSYLKFQRRAGPDVRPARGVSRHPLWYPFRVNGFPLFMVDTRTERAARTARNVQSAEIMTKDQMAALCEWLEAQPREVPKVVASPAILLPRHVRAMPYGNSGRKLALPATDADLRSAAAGALRSDAWDGYPASLHEVLACIAKASIPNVVFVSGDEHLSCVARAEIEWKDGPTVVVHSVHSSPLFAPFPFANSEHADLAHDDRFTIDGAGRHAGPVRCHAVTEFAPPGDGFAVLRFYRGDDGAWSMECAFDRAGATGDDAWRTVRKLA